jgi:hypothetical protein
LQKDHSSSVIRGKVLVNKDRLTKQYKQLVASK